MIIKGYVHQFGDNIDTDIIIPGRYCNTIDEKELAKKCMYDIRKEFYTSVKKGDIIVAGNNFGCGSSREVAPLALKGCGIQCIIAKSFARIFYRNAINIGLMVIELDLCDVVNSGDLYEINTEKSEIQNLKNGELYHYQCGMSTQLEEIIQANGLISYIKNVNRYLSNDYVRNGE